MSFQPGVTKCDACGKVLQEDEPIHYKSGKYACDSCATVYQYTLLVCYYDKTWDDKVRVNATSIQEAKRKLLEEHLANGDGDDVISYVYVLDQRENW